MDAKATTLKELLERVPRRHSADNVKEILAVVTGYEDLLMEIESVNSWYEKQTAVFFADLENIRAAIKKSTDNKASKKNKDNYFQEASGDLKQSMERLIEIYGNGSKSG